MKRYASYYFKLKKIKRLKLMFLHDIWYLLHITLYTLFCIHLLLMTGILREKVTNFFRLLKNIFLLLREFFTPALADCFSQEFEWQQVSSSLQNSSLYSSWSYWYCSLDGLFLSSYFQVFQSLYQSLRDCYKWTNHYWYYCHLHVP